MKNHATPLIDAPSTPTPVLTLLGSSAKLPLSRQDLDQTPNGAFRCVRGSRETYAVKVNGVLFPTTKVNAESTEYLARRFGSKTKHWCEAWALVQKIAKG